MSRPLSLYPKRGLMTHYQVSYKDSEWVSFMCAFQDYHWDFIVIPF